MNRAHHGFLVVLVLVFGSVFFVILTAFLGFVITQKQAQDAKRNSEQALAIAEAGLNYYKWYLAHNPDDITNGTGEAGPYELAYQDPEGGDIGSIFLTVESNNACGDITSIDIHSTGSTDDAPDIERSVYARYARPTIAEFAYIINSNVWAGDDRTIVGPYHSNGIIRMDGTNNSIVSSGQENWTCDGSLPCDPDDEGDTLDAVYGDGPGSDFWIFPQPPINFTGISLDLATIQERAEENGIFIGPSGDYGYRVRFNADGTISVYRVDSTYSYRGYTTEHGWQYERHVINDDDFYRTYTIPQDCPVIFVEDKVWLEGTVPAKVTIVAADVDTNGRDHSMILNSSIEYADSDAGLLAIAEEDMLVGLTVPDDMELNGIFVAQNGRFGRNHYITSYLDGWMDQYVWRDTLTVNGTIVSNGREGTKWVNGSEQFISGFETRHNSYDRDLVTDPPPLAPHTSDTYQFIEWREME